jgi:hypothetical protein
MQCIRVKVILRLRQQLLTETAEREKSPAGFKSKQFENPLVALNNLPVED